MPALLPTAGSTAASGASAVATSSSGTVVVSTSAGASTTVDSVSGPLFKGTNGWLKPIKTSELFEGIFGTAEYVPSAANYPGTKAALSSLRILLRIPAPKKKP
jgi:hypothetical protein